VTCDRHSTRKRRAGAIRALPFPFPDSIHSSESSASRPRRRRTRPCDDSILEQPISPPDEAVSPIVPSPRRRRFHPIGDSRRPTCAAGSASRPDAQQPHAAARLSPQCLPPERLRFREQMRTAELEMFSAQLPPGRFGLQGGCHLRPSGYEHKSPDHHHKEKGTIHISEVAEFKTWAIVEVMGHVEYAGVVTAETIDREALGALR
jgi:hypothetical protein